MSDLFLNLIQISVIIKHPKTNLILDFEKLGSNAIQ